VCRGLAPREAVRDDASVTEGDQHGSNEAGIAQILILILVVLAIIALTIWIVQQLT